MARIAFNKKKTLCSRKLYINLRKKLVKCYIWRIELRGAETWTLWELDQKYLQSSEVWYRRMMEKISWTDHLKKEVVLRRVEEEGNTIQ